jgi:1-acyl-sn-glycerol-3-phosphate acyltransferase
MVVWRLMMVVLHILKGLAICTFILPGSASSSQQKWIKRWSCELLDICRVRMEMIDRDGLPLAPKNVAPDTKHNVLVANHVSWLDIFVINAMEPCRFVAKSDIRDWPVLGYIARSVNTVFIARGKARDVRNAFHNLVESLKAGDRVAFFPEGTTSAQGAILPFHANLFEAAIDANVPVQPVALRYLDPQGKLYSGANFIGDMGFVESLLIILKGPTIRAQIIVLPSISSDIGNRRMLALTTHDQIASALGYPVASAVPATDVTTVSSIGERFGNIGQVEPAAPASEDALLAKSR